MKRAGLTQPSFYLYFSNKDAIFEELIADFHTHLRELITSFRLENVIKRQNGYWLLLAANPDLTRIGFFLNAEAKQMKRDVTLALKEYLEAEQRLGYFRSELEMETVAECLIGMIIHLTDLYLLPEIKDPANLSAEVVDLLIHGMLPIRVFPDKPQKRSESQMISIFMKVSLAVFMLAGGVIRFYTFHFK